MNPSNEAFPTETPIESRKGRHAIYCAAHRNPELVERIVRSLEHPRLDFFLHINSSVDATPFRNSSARHVPFRLRTEWGAYEMTEGIVRWLRMIRNDHYRSFTRISGQCYPVLSAEALVEELDRMDGPMYPMNRRPEDHVWRYRYFHVLSKGGWRGLRDRILKKVWFRERPIRQLPRDLRWGTGCSMWSLDKASVDWMLGFLDSRPDVEDFFRNVFASDETFFASLMASSPWADRTGPPTHYIDWTSGGSHPKDLDESDLSKILDSGRWFVRKVLPGKSDTLMDQLDALKRSR